MKIRRWLAMIGYIEEKGNKMLLIIGRNIIMKINKSYVVASAIIASTSILPLGNVEQVDAASKTVTVESRVNFRKGPSKKYASIRKLHKALRP